NGRSSKCHRLNSSWKLPHLVVVLPSNKPRTRKYERSVAHPHLQEIDLWRMHWRDDFEESPTAEPPPLGRYPGFDGHGHGWLIDGAESHRPSHLDGGRMAHGARLAAIVL